MHVCRERADAAGSQKKSVDGLVAAVNQAEKALNADYEVCKDLVSSFAMQAQANTMSECATVSWSNLPEFLQHKGNGLGFQCSVLLIVSLCAVHGSRRLAY